MLICIKCNTTLIGHGETDMVYIENKSFIQVQARVLTGIYPDPYSLHLRSQGVWNTIRGKYRFHMHGTYIQKVVVWFNFREDITDFEAFRCKFLSNGNVNVYFSFYTLKQLMKIFLKFLTFGNFKISFSIIQGELLSSIRKGSIRSPCVKC